jgi:hypothetical protein
MWVGAAAPIPLWRIVWVLPMWTPIELNLYFERFLNHERTSPPDFDIDFSHHDRDEVMDYVFKGYGSEHVSLMPLLTQYSSIISAITPSTIIAELVI